MDDLLLDGQSVLAALAGAAIAVALVLANYSYRPKRLRSYRAAIALTLVGAVAGLSWSVLRRAYAWQFPGWDWVIVALLGAGVALGELVSRFRDEPTRAVFTLPAFVYMSVNGLAAVAALAISQALGWSARMPGEDGGAGVHWLPVLTAGLGAMALLRSAIFTVRTGEQDVSVGPSTFLDAVLDAADRAVDRLRGQDRAWAVARAVEGIDAGAYPTALAVLPSYCLALSQSLKEEEQEAFLKRASSLAGQARASQHIKLLNLGLLIMTYFGEGVLNAAIGSLAGELERAAAAARGARSATADADQQARGALRGARAIVEKLRQTPAVPATVEAAAERHADQVARVVAAADSAAEQAAAASAATEAAAESAGALTHPSAATQPIHETPAGLHEALASPPNGTSGRGAPKPRSRVAARPDAPSQEIAPAADGLGEAAPAPPAGARGAGSHRGHGRGRAVAGQAGT
jgi:hypothetical protein